MLYLDEHAINKAVSMKEIIDGIDQAYMIYEDETFHMPTRFQVSESGNTLLLMPCFTEDYITTKLVTVYPNNKWIHQPTIEGLVVLNCNQTGKVKALMDGAYLTGLRTGAVGGSAVRHLAKQDASTLTIIGTGVQGFYQAIAACEERPINKIIVYNRTQGEKVASFIDRLKAAIAPGITICAAKSAEKAVSQAEIVITATTSSEPVLPDKKALLKGKLVIGVGSFQPDMREFPKALYNLASTIIVDTHDAIEESGDIAVPLKKGWIQEKDVQTLSTLIRKQTELPHHEDEAIIFKTTGMALFDAVVAAVIYQAAIQKSEGTWLDGNL